MLVIGMTALTWRFLARSPVYSPLQSATLETAGDGSTVDLVDGSRLELAARTRLDWVAGDGHSMTVRLMRGNVVCDITAIPGRSFAVSAADVQVRVTGTRFSVSFDPDVGRVEVSVQRGSVIVVTPGGSEPERRLSAGERLSIDRSQTKHQVADAAANGSGSTPESVRETAANSAPLNEIQVINSGRAGTSSAIALESPSARALLDQGNAARRAGDSRGAANAYQSLLTKYPRDPRAALAAFELGRLRMGPLSDVAGAVRAFQSAAALAPGSAIREDAMAHLVEAYAVSGQTTLCESARDAYLKGYTNGVHAAAVRRQCSAR